jgi:hypothetical protein
MDNRDLEMWMMHIRQEPRMIEYLFKELEWHKRILENIHVEIAKWENRCMRAEFKLMEALKEEE